MPITRENTQLLFQEMDLNELIQNQISRALFAVEETDPEELLHKPVEDQVDVIVKHFQLIVPILSEDEAYADQPTETFVQLNDYGRQIRLAATRYVTHFPFTGQQGLFRHYPATRGLQHPEATIRDGEIVIALVSYNTPAVQVTVEDLDKEIAKTVDGIKQFMEWQRPQVEAYNKELRDKARRKIEERKSRILETRQIAASLRYPLRRRTDAPSTYVAPKLRRVVSPVRRATPSGQRYTPEPTIDDEEYLHILKIMSGMALMMERSPRTFEKLDEEEIRDHFLLQLNGHYEGTATGETFNGEGKTDILVRSGDRNLFIGECKIWDGRNTLLEAIEQLFRYLTWRDTKSAIVIFSRKKNFTAVTETIKAVIEQHPHKKLGPVVETETRFRYVFGNPDDKDREIIVTVMAFCVLPASKPAGADPS
jgi:hypothetical protein